MGEGTPITTELIMGLTGAQRRQNGWPLPGVLYEQMRHEVDSGQRTIEDVMRDFPPEEAPGFYDPSICPICHGKQEICVRCGGTGIVCPRCRGMKVLYASGGGLVACGQCTDLQNQVAVRLQNAWTDWSGSGMAHGIAAREQDWTFEDGIWCDPGWENYPMIERLGNLAGWMQRWAVAPGLDDYDGIFLTGENGIGKSYLATAVVHEAVRHGGAAYKWRASMLLNWLRARHSPLAELSYERWFLELQMYRGILVIDEYGRARETDFAREVLSDLLTFRLERAGLPTILVTNMNLDVIRAAEMWLYSRIQLPNIRVPELAGLPDLRSMLASKQRPIPDVL